MDTEEMRNAYLRATQDDTVTQLNTEEMTKAFYKRFPTVMTVEDVMRQALEAADEIERLRREVRELRSEVQRLTVAAY